MTGPSANDSTAGYDAEAESLAQRYEAIPFETVHAAALPVLPAPPGRVLDVGAGTGRDAAAFAALGYRVTAAEPVAEMRRVARRLHADANVRWVDAALPELTGLDDEFDVVWLSAVWMHLDAAERRRAMARLRGLLAPGGLAVVTLRRGPVPPGRRMFTVTAAETVALAGESGLRGEILAAAGPDPLARPGVSWSTVLLRRPT